MLAAFEIEFYDDEDYTIQNTKGITFGEDMADVSRRIVNYYGTSIVKLILSPLEDVIDTMEISELESVLKTMGL